MFIISLQVHYNCALESLVLALGTVLQSILLHLPGVSVILLTHHSYILSNALAFAFTVTIKFSSISDRNKLPKPFLFFPPLETAALIFFFSFIKLH